MQYTCEELLGTLKAMNFAEIQEQGFIPLYKREKITDALHESCGFRTDYQFIAKSKMKTIQKKVKGKNKLLYFKTTAKTRKKTIVFFTIVFFDLFQLLSAVSISIRAP